MAKAGILLLIVLTKSTLSKDCQKAEGSSRRWIPVDKSTVYPETWLCANLIAQIVREEDWKRLGYFDFSEVQKGIMKPINQFDFSALYKIGRDGKIDFDLSMRAAVKDGQKWTIDSNPGFAATGELNVDMTLRYYKKTEKWKIKSTVWNKFPYLEGVYYMPDFAIKAAIEKVIDWYMNDAKVEWTFDEDGTHSSDLDVTRTERLKNGGIKTVDIYQIPPRLTPRRLGLNKL